jgi:hypothetical protein
MVLADAAMGAKTVSSVAAPTARRKLNISIFRIISSTNIACAARGGTREHSLIRDRPKKEGLRRYRARRWHFLLPVYFARLRLAWIGAANRTMLRHLIVVHNARFKKLLRRLSRGASFEFLDSCN